MTQVMAWPFEEVEIRPVDPSQIKRAKRDWPVAFTTVGVDVQKNRLEYTIVQFDRRLVNKHVAYHGIVPRTEGPECGRDLRRAVSKWRPMRVTIDGTYQFDWVNTMVQFAFSDLLMRNDPPVEIVRGYTGDSFGKPLRGGKGHGYFWGATDEAKVLINQDLATKKMTIDPDCPYYIEEQLASQKLVRIETAQKVRRKWVPVPGRRDEVLDNTGYAYMGVLALRIRPVYSPNLKTSGG